MKKQRKFLIFMATAASIGLGGCATSFDKSEMLKQFSPGEQSLYVVVPGKPKNLADIKDFSKFCGSQTGPTWGDQGNDYMKKHICPNLSQWQMVSGVYHTKVWGMKGLKYTSAYAPASMNIEEDDILELTISTSPDGEKMRPNLVKRIARKAKDATKESGCYWAGGKGATTAFIGGGAVSDGWHWRDQKFANE